MHFTKEELEDETREEWYLRQLLGSANFEGSRTLHILSGSLGYQIEHHLFPDLPSNRYPEISERVRALADKYDLPYTTGPLHRQYGQVIRTIMKLSLPNHMTKDKNPTQPERPDTADTYERDLRRKSDAERQPRRTELGGWSRAGLRRAHD
jgi:linoleoyl-CoA desaturase